jgi:hypothetical protein
MTFYFGLNINRNLTDIEDPVKALLNINLDIKDLERIKGVTDPGGVTRTDFRSLSGLQQDLERSLGSLNTESTTYDILTTNLYDESSFVDNNVIINGQLAATAIKYVYLDTDNTVKVADISTSRVSSWSSFDSPVTTSTPIFYGGEVELEGPIELSELIINGQAETRRFESEIPTHKIKIKVDETDVFLYAMKGIPLVFRGFFRNATLSANINQLGTIRPSWTITNISNNAEFVYENRLSGSLSQIIFTDSTARERDIRFFYPVDRITSLVLPSVTLIELPSVNLTSLVTLNISSNDFREFPNLTGYTSLTTLDIANNNLTRSKDLPLRTFSSSIVARLPSTLRSLTAGNCFTGVSTADLSSFPLTNLNLNAGGRFNRRLSGISPKVNSATIENYNITWNLFTNIDNSVKDSLTLKQIIITENGFVNNDMRFDSPELEIFQSDANRHNLVNVAGKTKLTEYLFRSASSAAIPGDTTVTNIFNGCTALRTINISDTPITGAIPPFVNCNSLFSVNFLFTQVTDAVPASGGNPPFVIGENTFNFCRSTLATFRVRSSQFSSSGQFHPDCFRLMPSLDYIEISSERRGITGPLPSFATARNITYILLYNNNLNGLIPNFDNNEKLIFLNLSNNQFVGPVPNIKAVTFQHLILTNNFLDSFNEIQSTQVLRIHLSFNNIKQIPNLSNLTRLQELLINNQRLGSSTFTYTAESFVGLTSLRTLNVTNNSIGQGFIDQMILDLSSNYDLNPRRGVVVNLRGNTPPSTSSEIQDAIRKLQIGGWTVLVD